MPPFPSRDNYFLAAAAFLVFPFLFYLFSTARSVHLSSRFAADPHPAAAFAVLIHAASSATSPRLLVPRRGSCSFRCPRWQRAQFPASRPGLAAFADRPDGAGESLLSLPDFSRRRVPKKLEEGYDGAAISHGRLGCLGPAFERAGLGVVPAGAAVFRLSVQRRVGVFYYRYKTLQDTDHTRISSSCSHPFRSRKRCLIRGGDKLCPGNFGWRSLRHQRSNGTWWGLCTGCNVEIFY